MATISTSQTFDSTARTAGEAFTIQNGAVFTIDSDTRDGKNAAAARAGSMSSYTMTGATGGEVLIDGRNVWIINYDGLIGTPNVPALGTIIRGVTSGATGELMNCSASISTTPTAAGAAMPATGIFKLKSKTGDFVDNEILEITGSTDLCLANGVGQRGWIEVVMDDAATFTIGRAQKFTIRGDWFESETTTSGTRGQQIQFPNYGGANFFIPWIEMETGVGTEIYEIIPACASGTGTPWATANLGTDEISKFVQCLGGGIIRIGSDGTNNIGFLPVSGCKVRLPNVFLKSAATASRASDSVPNATLATRPDFTVTNAGQVDVEYATGHWQFNLSQAYSVKLKYLGYFDYMNIAECATDIVIEKIANGNYTHGDVAAINLSTNFSGGTLTDCKFGRSGTIGSADYGTNTSYNNNLIFTRCHFQNRTVRTNGAAYVFISLYGSNIKLIDCVGVGSGIRFTGTAKGEITNFQYADSFVTTSSATNAPAGAIYLENLTSDIVVSGFSYYTSIANVHPDICLVGMANAQRIKIRNIGTRSAPLTGGSSNLMLYAINDTGICSDIKVQRVYVNNIGTRFILNTNSSKNITLENCSGDYADTNAQLALNVLVKNVGCASWATSGASVYGTIWYHIFTSTTAGRLGLAFNEPTEEFAAYVTTNFTTSATGKSGFNSNGGLALINSGDYAIFEFPYTIIGIDNFQNVVTVVTTATNMNTEYQIDTGSGWSAWKTFNNTNLFAEVVDEIAGFKFKIRITASATNAANILTTLYALTTSSTTAQDVLFPLDTFKLTLTGLQAGSDVVIYQAGTTTIRNSVDSVSSFSYTYETPESIDIGIFKSGYIPFYIRGYSLLSSDASLPIAQVVDRNYYNPGPTLATPANFTAVTFNDDQINLNWDDVVNATSYTVERSLTGLGSWSSVYVGATSAYNNTGLDPSTAYFYRVSATAPGYTTSGYATDSDTTDASSAITFVQKKSYLSTANADTHTIILDGTPVSGNLLVMSVSSDWYVNTPPSGWTAGPTVAESGVGSMFWKIAGVSEPTSINVTQVNGSDIPTSGPMCIGVLEYSGIATVSTVDQTNFNDADSSPLGSGAITTTVADELLVAAACFYSDTDTSISSWSNSFVQEMRVISTAGALLSLGVATRIVSATGTYSTEATAVNAASATHVGLIMSFKKA